jgi:hypothetical protein
MRPFLWFYSIDFLIFIMTTARIRLVRLINQIKSDARRCLLNSKTPRIIVRHPNMNRIHTMIEAIALKIEGILTSLGLTSACKRFSGVIATLPLLAVSTNGRWLVLFNGRHYNVLISKVNWRQRWKNLWKAIG